MRYFNVDNITFTNASGRTVAIKDILPLEAHTKETVNLKIMKNDSLDEIASRSNIYGEDHEMDAYRIFAENIEALTFVDFDLNRLKVLRIPS